MKDKVVAALLAFFLGGFGAHWFYLNRTKNGILYLLFFWTFIPGLLGFIDFISFLTMDKEKFDMRYNTAFVMNKNKVEPHEKIYRRLERLNEMKLKGILTEDEFELEKAKLMGYMD